MKRIKKLIGERIRRVREVLRLSQSKMASRFGEARSTYLTQEAGVRYPSCGVLYNLGMDGKISLDWLICGRGEMFYDDGRVMDEVLSFAAADPDIKEMLAYMMRDKYYMYRVIGDFIKYRRENPWVEPVEVHQEPQVELFFQE